MISKFVITLLVSTCVVQATLFNFTISARNLPFTDPFNGKPDPYVVVNYAPTSNLTDPLIRIGRTKVLKDTNNPDWAAVFRLDYVSTLQRLKLEVYDEDFFNDDFIGSIEFHLYEIVNATAKTFERRLSPNSTGVIIVNTAPKISNDA